MEVLVYWSLLTYVSPSFNKVLTLTRPGVH